MNTDLHSSPNNHFQLTTMNDGVSYKLPRGGETEFGRLDHQHQMWTLTMGGLYPSEVKERLERSMQGPEPRVMDVGCGSGIWSSQMAERFPKAKVVGVDLTAPQIEKLPINFSFRQHNLAVGLPSDYTDMFDVIHCRAVCKHVPDPQGLVDSIAKCLKPGGLLLISDGKTFGFDEEKKPLIPFIYDPSLSVEHNLENEKGLSWHAGWLRALGQVLHSPDYQPPFHLVRNSHLLKELMVNDLWAPIGWEGVDVKNGRIIGELAMKNAVRVYEYSRELLEKLKDVPRDVRDALRERGLEELQTKKIYFHTWYVVAARNEAVTPR